MGRNSHSKISDTTFDIPGICCCCCFPALAAVTLSCGPSQSRERDRQKKANIFG